MICRKKPLLNGICWLPLSLSLPLSLLLSALSLTLVPTRAAAQPLYSNGGINPRATSKSGVAAPTGSFWSELQNNAGNTTESNNILGSGGAAGTSRLADDFTVPAGATWTINSIDFYGYQVGAAASPSPFTSCNVQIWRGRPGDVGSAVIAGDLTTNRLAASIDTRIFRIGSSTVPAPGTAPDMTRRVWRNHATFATPVVLTAGTYCVDRDFNGYVVALYRELVSTVGAVVDQLSAEDDQRVATLIDVVLSDPDRLQALHDSGLMDGLPNIALDQIARMTTDALGTSLASVTLVGQDRQFLAGCNVPETGFPRSRPLTLSFSKFVVASGRTLIVHDATRHRLFAQHPAVQ